MFKDSASDDEIKQYAKDVSDNGKLVRGFWSAYAHRCLVVRMMQSRRLHQPSLRFDCQGTNGSL